MRLHQQISVIKKNPLEGLLGHAPFHRILITGAVEEVPDTTFSQLADGGKMLVPVGSPTQDLILYRKSDDFLEEMNLCSVVFSPLETNVASQTGTS
jgi:protein-L-isoaspartate(D-aspartate) O-methyltransferase